MPGQQLTAEERRKIEQSQSDLFKAVSQADRKRINEATNIISHEIAEWLRHKASVAQIIKIVRENAGLFGLSQDEDELNRALENLRAWVERYKFQAQEAGINEG